MVLASPRHSVWPLGDLLPAPPRCIPPGGHTIRGTPSAEAAVTAFRRGAGQKNFDHAEKAQPRRAVGRHPQAFFAM